MRPTVLVGCLAASEDAAPRAFARTLADALQARVDAVTVRASATLDGAEDEGPEPTRTDVRVEHAASAAAGLQRVIAGERPVLTVLGSARDAPHGRVSVGGTAERVLNGAARPVVVVPRGYGEHPLRTIAVGFVPTPEAVRALRTAAALARACDAELVVVTVLRRSPDASDAAVLAARLAPSLSAEARGPAAAILRDAIRATAGAEPGGGLRLRRSARLAVEPLVVVGDPSDALLRLSARVGLLVLGSRGYGPPGVVMPGGAARRVLGGARCPVMLVPAPRPTRGPRPRVRRSSTTDEATSSRA